MKITVVEDMKSKSLDLIPDKIELTAPESTIQDTYGVFIGRYNKDMDIKMLKFRELKMGLLF